ncbi:MAG: hypothetical protein LBC20_06500 [Planctomycetaceae bacterium]|jgi:hypothetical protein|nr:hypothetical protein [Planctomycetaceae bacterium]
MNIHAETKILLPEHFSDTIKEIEFEKIVKIIDVANNIIDLSSQGKAKDIAAIFANDQNRFDVSVQLYFMNAPPIVKTNLLFRWIIISFVDNRTHEEMFWKEFNRRNLALEFEQADEFRKKYYTTPKSIFQINVSYKTSDISGNGTDITSQHPRLLAVQHVFGIDRLIITFKHDFSTLYLYRYPKFEDGEEQILSVHWDKNGTITKTEIDTLKQLKTKLIKDEVLEDFLINFPRNLE